MSPLTTFIVVSATWRLTSLCANETGPFYVFEKIRKYAERLCETNKFWRAFHLYEGICCEWCCSIWIAAPLTVAWYLLGDTIAWPLLPFAISAWVIVFKYVVEVLTGTAAKSTGDSQSNHSQTIGDKK